MYDADVIDRLDRSADQPPAHFAIGEVELSGLEAHQLIYAEGDSADFLFHVEEGCVCSFRCDPAGQRGIDAFHLPNEIFGLDADFSRLRRDGVITIDGGRMAWTGRVDHRTLSV